MNSTQYFIVINNDDYISYISDVEQSLPDDYEQIVAPEWLSYSDAELLLGHHKKHIVDENRVKACIDIILTKREFNASKKRLSSLHEKISLEERLQNDTVELMSQFNSERMRNNELSEKLTNLLQEDS